MEKKTAKQINTKKTHHQQQTIFWSYSYGLNKIAWPGPGKPFP